MAEEAKKSPSGKGGGDQAAKKQIDVDEFEWIQLNKDLAKRRDETRPETPMEKLKRKFAENPLIPVGCGLTAFCLASGLFKFARKDSAGSQTMMRGRIVAQGFTIAAMLGGIIVSARKNRSTSQKPAV